MTDTEEIDLKQKIINRLDEDVEDLRQASLESYVSSVIHQNAKLVYDDQWATPAAVRSMAVDLRDEAKKLLNAHDSAYRRDLLAKHETFLASLD